LFAGGACYALAFRLRPGRNAQTYAALGLLLVLAGTRIALPSPAAAAVWTALAVTRLAWPRQALRGHASAYMFLALLAAGTVTSAARILLGGDPPAPVPTALAWQGAAAALCWGIATSRQAPRLFRAILAAATVWLFGGILAAGLTSLYHTVFGGLAPHAYCATLRTAVLAAVALLLAAAVSRGKRSELAPLVYSLMILGAYRLLFVDLHQDIKAAVVLSLLIYGAALTLLPRLMQLGWVVG
jgi:hypothetical protein